MTKAEEQIIRAIERWLYVLVMFTSLYCFAIEFFPNTLSVLVLEVYQRQL